jgi:hypothetical protein
MVSVDFFWRSVVPPSHLPTGVAQEVQVHRVNHHSRVCRQSARTGQQHLSDVPKGKQRKIKFTRGQQLIYLSEAAMGFYTVFLKHARVTATAIRPLSREHYSPTSSTQGLDVIEDTARAAFAIEFGQRGGAN